MTHLQAGFVTVAVVALAVIAFCRLLLALRR
jgi:hypothetical protein